MLRLALNRRCRNNKQRAAYLRQALLYCYGLSVGKIDCIQSFAHQSRKEYASYCYYWQQGNQHLILEVFNPPQKDHVWDELDNIAPCIFQAFADSYNVDEKRLTRFLKKNVIAGQNPSSPSNQKIIFCAEYYKLSFRQAHSLCCLAHGYSMQQTAEKLGIKLPTLKSHLNKVYKILRVNNANAAINVINRGACQWIH